MRAFEDDDVIHAEDTVDPAPYPNWIASRNIYEHFIAKGELDTFEYMW